ncbi:Mu-like prophage major head subunit gpT family protein [Alkalicoccus chagannorensis]|uniref:phage major capsid protein n=1 Tax=Alkalicoccus chagannorensis TaxID=427072 RepID=UPI00042379FA|nr:Mu-like prophage major head subunit gpT family protein [Alkalicoccus chagannorensis]
MSQSNMINIVKDIRDEVVDSSQANSSFLETSSRSVSTMAQQAKQDPERQRRFAESAQLLAGVMQGKLPTHALQEAMATSDFPLLFGDVIDRLLLAGYRHSPQTFQAYTRVTTVPDFRPVNRHYVDGADGVLDEVKQQQEYKLDTMDEGKYQYQVKKFGKLLQFAWETLINDDLDAFADAPERLGRGARRSEEKFVTNLFLSGSGPRGTFFTSGNNNVIEGNPKLNVEGIQKGFTQMRSQKDPTTGEPIYNRPRYLVVPPELEVQARQIINATEIRSKGTGGGTSEQEMITANWMRNDLQIVVNDYIPVVAKDAANPPWFLFADPSEGRGAMEFGRLRGYEDPTLMMKSPNAMRPGGGQLGDPMWGDFDTDSITYKVRHVFGGTLMDPRYAVASNGSGE